MGQAECSLIGWWERKWPQLENSLHRLLKPNAATSDGLATLMPMCSPMEKWTHVHPNTRTTQTLPRAVDFPVPSPGLMMVPPRPPLLRISDLTEHGWVAFHTPLCPETSFQTCLPGTVLVFSFHPVIRGLSDLRQAAGASQKARSVGCLYQLQHPGNHSAHTYTLEPLGSTRAPRGGAARYLDQWPSAPSDTRPHW